jgi:hypothetical protein
LCLGSAPGECPWRAFPRCHMFRVHFVRLWVGVLFCAPQRARIEELEVQEERLTSELDDNIDRVTSLTAELEAVSTELAQLKVRQVCLMPWRLSHDPRPPHKPSSCASAIVQSVPHGVARTVFAGMLPPSGVEHSCGCPE